MAITVIWAPWPKRFAKLRGVANASSSEVNTIASTTSPLIAGSEGMSPERSRCRYQRQSYRRTSVRPASTWLFVAGATVIRPLQAS
jgi:hypothetical protein